MKNPFKKAVGLFTLCKPFCVWKVGILIGFFVLFILCRPYISVKPLVPVQLDFSVFFI